MSIDIPRGWQITEQAPDEDHHIHCSWRQARMLCDCDVIWKHPEFLDESKFYGKDGVVIRENKK